MMNRTKRVAAVLAFVLAVTSATASAAETDISGEWIVTLDFVTNKATIEATIKQTEDKLAAEVLTPAGRLDFNGTLVDNKISAVYSMQVQGNVLEIRMNGIVEAETLSGTIAFGRGQEVKWTAVRKSAVSVSESDGAAPVPDSAPEIVPEPPK